jgi:hypothetical protein
MQTGSFMIVFMHENSFLCRGPKLLTMSSSLKASSNSGLLSARWLVPIKVYTLLPLFKEGINSPVTAGSSTTNDQNDHLND